MNGHSNTRGEEDKNKERMEENVGNCKWILDLRGY